MPNKFFHKIPIVHIQKKKKIERNEPDNYYRMVYIAKVIIIIIRQILFYSFDDSSFYILYKT